MSEPKTYTDQWGNVYIPTPEELAGNTWNYCFGQDVGIVRPPEAQEEDHEHHQ